MARWSVVFQVCFLFFTHTIWWQCFSNQLKPSTPEFLYCLLCISARIMDENDPMRWNHMALALFWNREILAVDCGNEKFLPSVYKKPLKISCSNSENCWIVFFVRIISYCLETPWFSHLHVFRSKLFFSHMHHGAVLSGNTDWYRHRVFPPWKIMASAQGCHVKKGQVWSHEIRESSVGFFCFCHVVVVAQWWTTKGLAAQKEMFIMFQVLLRLLFFWRRLNSSRP